MGLDEVRRQLAVSLVSKDDDELADNSDSEDEHHTARNWTACHGP